mgnify:CR=1 FL=1
MTDDRRRKTEDVRSYSVPLPDEHATAELGKKIAAGLRPGNVVALSGDLGAGKTTLARAIIRALTGTDEPVPSPTFTLLQQYPSERGVIWHYDWYRLKHAEDIFELDFEEALATGITLIEWPQRAAAYVPASALWCRITMQAGGGRMMECSGSR